MVDSLEFYKGRWGAVPSVSLPAIPFSPLKISPILEIIRSHPLLGVYIFEFSAPLLKCFSFWKIAIHPSTPRSLPPWRLLCLALVWYPAGWGLTLHYCLAFSPCLKCAGIVPQVLCTCHSLCSWSCAPSESFWPVLMSQLIGHICRGLSL